MARHRFSNPPFDQINVTPLIDTLFFLLIIFMITAPLLEYSMDVTPPSYKAADIKPDDNSKIVNIRKDGVIMFEGAKMERQRTQVQFFPPRRRESALRNSRRRAPQHQERRFQRSFPDNLRGGVRRL